MLRGRVVSRSLAALAPLALVPLAGCGYNTIQTLDEQASAAQHNIEVQLQRRADLIPNLVATVKGVAQQELDVFVGVAKARAGLVDAIQSGDPERMANADDALRAQVAILNRSVTEAYPQLRSNENFTRLQDELTGTENRIAVSRNDYNQTVQQYNTYIRRFPEKITASVTGAKPRKYFEVTNPAAREAPTVDFTKTPTATPTPAGNGSRPAPAPARR